MSATSELPEVAAAGATGLAPPHPPSAGGLSKLGIVVLLMGFSLAITDFFVVNVALPTMGRDLHASTAALELIVAGYGVAYAVLLVLGGRLGDAHGRRRLFLGGVGAFTLTSLACGLAPNAAVLIAGRVAQGASAAMMVPQVLATFHASLDGHRRARAIGAYGATGGLAMILGLALGGLIVSLNVGGSGWRGIFLVNVPIGLLALLRMRRYVPETRSEQPSPIDVPGTVLLAAVLLCLLVPLTEGRVLGWPWWSWVLLALVPAGAVAFARLESTLAARGRMPLLPPSILLVRSVTRGLTVGIPFFASFGGFMFVYALVSQDEVGLSPVKAGVALTPYAAFFFASSLCSTRLVRRFGNAAIAWGGGVQGLAIVLIGVTLMANPHHLVWPVFGLLFAMMGIGQGMVISPLIRIILLAVPGHLAGAGTGVVTTAQQSSLAIGVALVGALYVGLVPAVGFADAAAITLGVEALTSLGVVLGARWLPELS